MFQGQWQCTIFRYFVGKSCAVVCRATGANIFLIVFVLVQNSTLKLVTLHGAVVQSKSFTLFIMIVVIVNAILLSLNRYPMTDEETLQIEVAEYVFFCIYFVEAVYKIFAMGSSTYFSSKFNKLDFAVVALSIPELALAYTGREDLTINISVLRSFRIVRLFRYTGYWESMRDFSYGLIDNFASIMSLVTLLLIFIFVAALMGMQLFGGRFYADAGLPRTNFDNFSGAYAAIFQLVTGEDWNVVMYASSFCDAALLVVDHINVCCLSGGCGPYYCVLFAWRLSV